MSQITACSATMTKAPARQELATVETKLQGLAQNTAHNCWYNSHSAYIVHLPPLSHI